MDFHLIRERGFTLVEMVVAIAIFSVISVAVYGTVARFMEVNQELADRSDKLARINTMFTLMERDVHNYVERGIRGAYGNNLPSFQPSSVNEGQSVLFEFTTELPSYQRFDEAAMSRVGWQFTDNRIIRQSWDVLDRAQDSEPLDESILNDVETAEVNYYVDNGKRQYQIENQWNSLTAPPGIVVTITMSDGAVYSRVFNFVGG